MSGGDLSFPWLDRFSQRGWMDFVDLDLSMCAGEGLMELIHGRILRRTPFVCYLCMCMCMCMCMWFSLCLYDLLLSYLSVVKTT